VDEAEAEVIFDGCSRDMDDLRLYIAGKKGVLWKPADDATLQAYQDDQKANAAAYKKLQKEKGEPSIKKRIEFLKLGKKSTSH
jgi:hypothetical protein